MVLGPIHAPAYPNEYPNHFKGKVRVANILEDMGAQEVEVEKWMRNQEVELIGGILTVDYRFDVFGILNDFEICVEIDTIKSGGGHLSAYAQYKNRRRDNHFKERKVITVRFATSWVWSRKQLTDNDIREEILCSIANESLKPKFTN